MNTKVTSILGHDVDTTAMSPEDMVNNAMRAHTLPRETNVLSQLLLQAELCLQFIGGDRSLDGKMQQTTPDQVLYAASTQSFQVEPLPALNALRLRFDDDYLYGIHLPKSEPVDFDMLLRAFELESLRNAIISIENSRRMGFEQKARDLSFLTEPLANQAMKMILPRCDVAKGILGKDDIRFAPASPAELLQMSQDKLYVVSGDPHSLRFNIQFGATIYPCTLKNVDDQPLWDAMFQALKSESELNHARVREMDPEIAQLRERMKNAAFDIPGLQDALQDPSPEQPGDDTTRVVPFRRR